MHKKITVVLDTNIFISALLFKGIPAKILEFCIFNEEINIAISPELLAELIGKLKYKFAVQSSILSEMEDFFSSRFAYILPLYKTNICRDADDNLILDLAIAADADYIITGDKDLLNLEAFEGVKILKPVDFLKKHIP